MYGIKQAIGDAADEEPSKVRRRQPALFTAEQIREFKTLGIEPGVKILGFKDKETLRFQDNLKHALFIYPDEKTYSGSTRTFNALLKATLNRDKVILARFMPRRASVPSFAALVPQAEKVTEQGQQAPPGFHMIALPFADEIRAPPFELLKGAEEQQTDAACKIIEKLTLKSQGYVPDTYLNPSLSLHYGLLQATAFNEEYDLERDFADTSLPNYEMIHQRAGSQMAVWKELLDDGVVASAPVASATSTKRKADTSVDEVHIRDYYNDGRMSKLTVAQLKSFCKAKSLQITGTKAVLVERVETYLGTHE